MSLGADPRHDRAPRLHAHGKSAQTESDFACLEQNDRMKNTMKFARMLFTGLAILALARLAVAGINLDVSIQIGHEISPVVVETDASGPPPWAPAHGRRAKDVYYYYPAYEVYRNASTGAWIYLSGDGWQVGAALPTHFSINSESSFVSLEMSTDRPYLYHESVLHWYPKAKFASSSRDASSSGHVPPGQAKKSHGNGKSGKKK